MNTTKTVFHWSGGKDSSIALHLILKNKEYQIDRLLTTIHRKNDRVTMHGVRKELIKRQAINIGLPVTFLELPDQPGMDEYNRLMMEQMHQLKQEGFTHAAFGDIFLEDLKIYREQQTEKAGFNSLFPIWKQNTSALIRQFIDDGFKAVVVSADAKILGENFIGREIDDRFLSDLPGDVDPCGENGEFHTFVYDGPIFSNPIPFRKGERTYREYDAPSKEESNSKKMGFWFYDLLPQEDHKA